MDSKTAEEVEAKIGYIFKNKELLSRALTHSSYANEKKVQSNENLEFLGDSVLELIIAEHLYRKVSIKLDGHCEGLMTDMRVNIVSKKPLTDAFLRLSLDSYLKFGKGLASKEDHTFEKTLSSFYEAILGAIYLDGGLRPAKKFVLSTLKPEIKGAIKLKNASSSKNRLQEYLQKQGRAVPVYKTSLSGKEFRSKVYVNGTLLGSGNGRSKKQAELRAAESALKEIH
ncbi:MAG: ribonuclease III [Clostridia bacterium]|nr:ribonuclease III [Clostridia bacterium]